MVLFNFKEPLNMGALRKVLGSTQTRLILLDVDGTIAPHNTFNVDAKSREIIDVMKQNAQVCLFTNNRDEAACAELAQDLGVDYVSITGKMHNRKPNPMSAKRIMKHYEIPPKNTLIIGDKHHADTLCSLFAGVGACYKVKRIA